MATYYIGADVLCLCPCGQSGTGRTPISVEARAATGDLNQQDLLVHCLSHEIAEGIFRSNVVAEFVIGFATTVARGEISVHASVNNPDIVASNQRFAVRLECFQQGAVLLVFAEEVDRLDIGLTIHVGLAGKDEDFDGTLARLFQGRALICLLGKD